MKNMIKTSKMAFLILKLKMGSRMLRLISETKWAIHPEGWSPTKIVKPRGGAFSYPPQTQQNKLISPLIIYHTGGGHPPSPVTVQNCMSRILVFT